MRHVLLPLALGATLACGCGTPAKPASVWTMPMSASDAPARALRGLSWGATNAPDGIRTTIDEPRGSHRSRGELPELTVHRRPGVWRENADAALAEARHTGRGVVVRFSADWCSACNRLAVETFRDPRVLHALDADFVPLLVDVTEPSQRRERLLERHAVTKVPVVLVLDARGRELARIEEFVDPDTLSARLASASTALRRGRPARAAH